MPLYVKSPCGPCCGGPCGPLSITAGACVSREGNGSLCGTSKLLNFNSGDWNLRKFKTTTVSGQLITCWWQGGAGDFCTGHYQFSCNNYTAYGLGASTWDTGACTLTTINVRTDYVVTNKYLDSPCSQVLGGSGSFYDAAGGSFSATIRPASQNVTHTILGELSRQATANSRICASGGGVWDGSGSLSLVISNPDTVDAALARGGVSAAGWCRTSPGSIGTTSAGAEGTLAVTGPRSVKVPFTLSGVTPGTFSFVVDLNVYNTSDVFQGAEEVTVTVELEEGDITDCEATYWYDVPLRTGERVQFVAVRDLAAA